MSLNFLPFGQIDLQGFLSSRKGEIRLDLIDAGMVRPVEAQYDFQTKGDVLLVTPRLKRGTAPVASIPKIIPLTPWLVAFFGMYDGDGNKTNNIGFAQSEVHLQDFALAGEQALFGNQFETEVSILEDSKRFEGPAVIARMAEIRELLIQGGLPEPVERTLQEHFLFEEYSAMLAAHVTKPRMEDIRFTISPKKGATKSGGSSYEIIINLKKSKYFLPLFLSIVKEVLASIHHDQANRNGIEWIGSPRTAARQGVDLERFAQSDRCSYLTGAGARKGYQFVATDATTVRIRKGLEEPLTVARLLPLTPLVSVMLGIYLAEGTTTKAKIFRIMDEPGIAADLHIGFNSSEQISLDIFLSALEVIFPKHRTEVVEAWIVKIGTKYFAECHALGEKLGAPNIRGGKKGQGIGRGTEITAAFRTWALEQFPILNAWADRFGYIMYTGAGIARVDFRCKGTGALLFFSLLRDLFFDIQGVEPFVIAIP